MNYIMGSGIIRYIRASKTFSKFRSFRSSVRLIETDRNETDRSRSDRSETERDR